MNRTVRILLGMAALLLGAPTAPARDEKQPKFLLSWGHKGDQPGEFHSPIGIAVTPKDEVYVVDVNNARVQKFTSEGKYLGGFDLPHDEPKRKSAQVGGIAVDAAGRILLSFMLQHRIGVYAEDGALIREWGKKGAGEGEFNQPGGILLMPEGSVFVADQCNHRVQRFTGEGKFLGTWGGHGGQPGQFGGPDAPGSRFAGPHFITRDSKDRLYTTEGILGRVQQLSLDGTPLGAWGDKGSEPGGFGSLKTPYNGGTFGPIGILADRHDRVWVSSLNDRVQLFTPEGKYLLGIGGSGTGPGQFARPHGLALDRQGHLYVVDAGNQRIQVFEIPEP
jgi:sugar lactone lactonase YvrE